MREKSIQQWKRVKLIHDLEAMKIEDETAKIVGIHSFNSADKGSERGLEAADFSAWHWNKYYMDKIRAGKEMEPRKDFEALANIAGNKIKQIFATGAILQYFFSLIPPPTEHQSD